MKYIYGAAFDPITTAHLEIIRQILKIMQLNDTLDILVSNNDEKKYQASINDRMTLVNLALNECFHNKQFNIVEQSQRMFRHLIDTYEDDTEITIVMGLDQWLSLTDKQWDNSDHLLTNYKFFVFDRGNNFIYKKDHNIYNVTYSVLDKKLSNVSSTAVRFMLNMNPNTHYDELNNMLTRSVFDTIKENELYHQNSSEYDIKLNEFLQEYVIEKEKNYWSEPSVTTDVVAYNDNRQILLIRRRNYPYKNYWCLPGGFFEKTDKDLNYCAARELGEETHIVIDPNEFIQLKAYGHSFDPRMKICDVAFVVHVSLKQMNDFMADDDAIDACWFSLDQLPVLGFHHAEIVNEFCKMIKSE